MSSPSSDLRHANTTLVVGSDVASMDPEKIDEEDQHSVDHDPRMAIGLGCQRIDQPGTSMEEPGWREASAVGRRHESSHGKFRGQPDQ